MAVIRTHAKEALKCLLPRRAPIIVNSFGRSGSTLLHDALVEAATLRSTNRLASRLVRANAWELDTHPLYRGGVFKTHDRYTVTAATVVAHAKHIYIYGDPVEATLSTIARTKREGQPWLDEHCDHLRVPRVTPEELVHRDALQIEAHMSSWMRCASPVLFVRLDRLWDNITSIEQFVSMPVPLPEQAPRRSKTNLPREHIAGVEATYANFANWLDALPDAFISPHPS